MIQIFSNIGALDWWFNIIFASFIGLLINKIIKDTPKWFKGLKRKWKLKRFKFIKNNRRDSCAINYQISNGVIKFIVFSLAMMSFLTWLTYKPVQQLFEASFLAGMLLSIPVYLCEIIWLKQDVLIKELLEHRNKLRIKSALKRN